MFICSVVLRARGSPGSSAQSRRCRWGWGWVVMSALLAGCGKPSDLRELPEPVTRNGEDTAPELASMARFEDHTKQADIDFAHQLADGKLDNIKESDGAGGAILDYDADGWMDLYLVNSGPAPVLTDAAAGTPRWPNRLYRNRGDGTMEDVTNRAGVAGHGFGTTAAAADYDNDGFTDLLVVNFGGLILYHNKGNGTFEEVTQAVGLTSMGPGISATFLDADNDGRVDLVISTLGGRAMLWRNVVSTGNHWLRVRLEGTQGNRDGLGARVLLTVGGNQLVAEMRCPTSYLFQQEPRLHFGLGPNAVVDALEVRWSSGQNQVLTNIPANQVLKIIEPGASRWARRS